MMVIEVCIDLMLSSLQLISAELGMPQGLTTQ